MRVNSLTELPLREWDGKRQLGRQVSASACLRRQDEL